MHAIEVAETGGPEVLRYVEKPVPSPGPGEVLIKSDAIGVNYIDTYFRSGIYPRALPYVVGTEVCGTVAAVGADVAAISIGDRVVTAGAVGAYAEYCVAPADFVAYVPDSVPSDAVASALLKGMTAHYLAGDTFPLKAGDTALVHAGAGGVGLLLTQIAKLRGARVLATVGTEEKAGLARAAGADAVCIYTRENFPDAVKAFTGGRGVDVAYDAIGRDTFEGTLASLRPRGMLVSYGNSSGPVAPFAPLLLSQKGSLFFTRPTLAHYTLTTAELQARVGELFGWVAAGKLTVRIGATYPLAQAAEAHRALEGRRTTGKVLLVP